MNETAIIGLSGSQSQFHVEARSSEVVDRWMQGGMASFMLVADSHGGVDLVVHIPCEQIGWVRPRSTS